MKRDSIIETILDHLNMKPEEVLFHNNGRRSNWPVSKARHLIKFFLYVYRQQSTPAIHRKMKRYSTGFDHASTLYSVGIVRNQGYLFREDVIAIRDRLNCRQIVHKKKQRNFDISEK